MDATAISTEIQHIRARLTRMEEERAALPAEAFARKAELRDEEHGLDARLAELREAAARAGAPTGPRS